MKGISLVNVILKGESIDRTFCMNANSKTRNKIRATKTNRKMFGMI